MSVVFRQAVEEKRWQRFLKKKLREEAVDDGNEYVVLSHSPSPMRRQRPIGLRRSIFVGLKEIRWTVLNAHREKNPN